MKYIRFLRVFGCLTMTLLFVCGIASAEIAIAPLTRTIQVAPGKTETVLYKVANRGKEPENINIGARTWFSLPENADIGIEKWLEFEADKLTLAPDQEKEFKVKVDVPKEAKGELAAMVYITPERQAGQTIGTSYGVSLYVFVKGTEIVEPEIGNVSLSKREGSFYLAVTIENKGNVHFRPRVSGIVRAKQAFSEEVTLPFGKPIFGGQSHAFIGKIKGQLPKEGRGEVEVSCRYGEGEDTILKKTVSLNLDDIKEEI